MFEKASRLALRFETPRGLLTVEDLWNLPLTSTTGKANLDDLARAIYRRLNVDSIPSFVEGSRPSEGDELALDIVKHIIGVKLEEGRQRQLAQANREKKQRILELIAQKEDQALEGQTLEDLKKLADSL